MAAQEFSGSAAWLHNAVAAAVVEGDVVSFDEAFPALACIPLIFSPLAAEFVGVVPLAAPPNWPPLPAMIAAEIETGKASVPVGKSIRLNGHDPSRFL